MRLYINKIIEQIKEDKAWSICVVLGTIAGLFIWWPIFFP